MNLCNRIKPVAYILQKAIPGQQVGTRYVIHIYPDNSYEFRPVSEGAPGPVFSADIVENNKEWFVPEIANELQRSIDVCVSNGYRVTGKYDCLPSPGAKYTQADMHECFVAGVRWAQDDTVVERRYWAEKAFDACLKSINK